MHDSPQRNPDIEARQSAPERILARLENVAAFISGSILAVAMLIIVTDVLMRYLFNNPLRWSYDLMSLFMIPAIFFLALSQTLRVGGHVSVDFFSKLMSPGLGRVVYAAGMLVGLGSVSFMTYALGVEAFRSFSSYEAAFGFYVWPIWIAKIIAFGGVAVFSFRTLLLLLEAIAGRDVGR